MKKKSLLSLLVFSLMSLMNVSHAAEPSYSQSRSCGECCPCPKPLCPQYTCLERCCCCRDESSVVSFDWLYLKPSKNFPSYGFYLPDKNTNINSSKTDLYPTEQSVKFKSAYRITALSPNLADRWQIGVDWLGYYPKFDPVSKTDSQSNLVANYVIPSLGFFGNAHVNSVEGKWKLRLNEFDLFLRKALCLKGFTVVPYAGVKIGWIKQNVEAKYGAFEIVDFEAPTPHVYRGKSRFTGGGPLFGIDFCYWLFRELHLFFKGELAGVAGKFKNTVSFEEIEFLPPGYIEKLESNRTVISDVRHWQAGLEWTPEFGCLAFRLLVGWEGWLWGGSVGIPTVPTLTQPSIETNLSLYGPFVRIGAVF